MHVQGPGAHLLHTHHDGADGTPVHARGHVEEHLGA